MGSPRRRDDPCTEGEASRRLAELEKRLAEADSSKRLAELEKRLAVRESELCVARKRNRQLQRRLAEAVSHADITRLSGPAIGSVVRTRYIIRRGGTATDGEESAPPSIAPASDDSAPPPSPLTDEPSRGSKAPSRIALARRAIVHRLRRARAAAPSAATATATATMVPPSPPPAARSVVAAVPTEVSTMPTLRAHTTPMAAPAAAAMAPLEVGPVVAVRIDGGARRASARAASGKAARWGAEADVGRRASHADGGGGVDDDKGDEGDDRARPCWDDHGDDEDEAAWWSCDVCEALGRRGAHWGGLVLCAGGGPPPPSASPSRVAADPAAANHPAA